MDRAREQARAFLQEAVYRSRARQAAGSALAAFPADADARRCGLGAKAAVELDLSERGSELFAALWPDGLGSSALERVRAAMRGWIERQDALDRKRNHFLRDFRARHGADRRAYDPAVLATFDQGLGAVNAEVERGLDDAAAALLASARAASSA